MDDIRAEDGPSRILSLCRRDWSDLLRSSAVQPLPSSVSTRDGEAWKWLRSQCPARVHAALAVEDPTRMRLFELLKREVGDEGGLFMYVSMPERATPFRSRGGRILDRRRRAAGSSSLSSMGKQRVPPPQRNTLTKSSADTCAHFPVEERQTNTRNAIIPAASTAQTSEAAAVEFDALCFKSWSEVQFHNSSAASSSDKLPQPPTSRALEAERQLVARLQVLDSTELGSRSVLAFDPAATLNCGADANGLSSHEKEGACLNSLAEKHRMVESIADLLLLNALPTTPAECGGLRVSTWRRRPTTRQEIVRDTTFVTPAKPSALGSAGNGSITMASWGCVLAHALLEALADSHRRATQQQGEKNTTCSTPASAASACTTASAPDDVSKFDDSTSALPLESKVLVEAVSHLYATSTSEGSEKAMVHDDKCTRTPGSETLDSVLSPMPLAVVKEKFGGMVRRSQVPSYETVAAFFRTRMKVQSGQDLCRVLFSVSLDSWQSIDDKVCAFYAQGILHWHAERVADALCLSLEADALRVEQQAKTRKRKKLRKRMVRVRQRVAQDAASLARAKRDRARERVRESIKSVVLEAIHAAVTRSQMRTDYHAVYHIESVKYRDSSSSAREGEGEGDGRNAVVVRSPIKRCCDPARGGADDIDVDIDVDVDIDDDDDAGGVSGAPAQDDTDTDTASHDAVATTMGKTELADTADVLGAQQQQQGDNNTRPDNNKVVLERSSSESRSAATATATATATAVSAFINGTTDHDATDTPDYSHHHHDGDHDEDDEDSDIAARGSEYDHHTTDSDAAYTTCSSSSSSSGRSRYRTMSETSASEYGYDSSTMAWSTSSNVVGRNPVPAPLPSHLPPAAATDAAPYSTRPPTTQAGAAAAATAAAAAAQTSLPWEDVTRMLHADIADMAKSLESLAELRRPWQIAVSLRIKEIVCEIWPCAWAEVYGSIGSGLAAPCSDLDMVVHHAPAHIDCVNTLAEHLRKQEWVQMLQAIEHTAVPVIKLTTACIPIAFGNSGSLISVDITFETTSHRGVNTMLLVRQLVQQYPPLKPLTLVLKQFLVEKGLNDPFVGGLTSYGLVIMIVAVIQRYLADLMKADDASSSPRVAHGDQLGGGGGAMVAMGDAAAAAASASHQLYYFDQQQQQQQQQVHASNCFTSSSSHPPSPWAPAAAPASIIAPSVGGQFPGAHHGMMSAPPTPHVMMRPHGHAQPPFPCPPHGPSGGAFDSAIEWATGAATISNGSIHSNNGRSSNGNGDYRQQGVAAEGQVRSSTGAAAAAAAAAAEGGGGVQAAAAAAAGGVYLGEIFMRFLRTYSAASFVNDGVSIRSAVAVAAAAAAVGSSSSNSLARPDSAIGAPVYIEDPLDARNNVGSSCFGVHQVMQAFREALEAIQLSSVPAARVDMEDEWSILGRVFATGHHHHVVNLVAKVWCPPEKPMRRSGRRTSTSSATAATAITTPAAAASAGVNNELRQWASAAYSMLRQVEAAGRSSEGDASNSSSTSSGKCVACGAAGQQRHLANCHLTRLLASFVVAKFDSLE